MTQRRWADRIASVQEDGLPVDEIRSALARHVGLAVDDPAGPLRVIS
jgi:hypothetical protein